MAGAATSSLGHQLRETETDQRFKRHRYVLTMLLGNNVAIRSGAASLSLSSRRRSLLAACRLQGRMLRRRSVPRRLGDAIGRFNCEAARSRSSFFFMPHRHNLSSFFSYSHSLRPDTRDPRTTCVPLLLSAQCRDRTSALHVSGVVVHSRAGIKRQMALQVLLWPACE